MIRGLALPGPLSDAAIHKLSQAAVHRHHSESRANWENVDFGMT